MTVSRHLLLATLAAIALTHGCAPAWGAKKAAGKPAPQVAACAKEPAKADQVKLLGGDQLAFTSMDPSKVVPVPLTLPSTIDPDQVQVTLVQVRRDKVVDDALVKHFQVDPKLAKSASGVPLVKVTVNEVPKLLPASYQILLRLSCVQADVSFSLERPAVVLQKIEKFNLDVSQWLGFGATGSAAPETVRWSAADNTALATPRDVTFRDVGWRSAVPENVNASLGAKFASADATGLTFSLAPSGFPVGTSTGKLELNSPDLKTPMTVDVEVKVRLYTFWIPLLVLLGIFIGALVRERLPQFIALRLAQSKGTAATLELRKQIAPIKDPRFVEMTRQPLAALEALWAPTGKTASAADRTEAIVHAQSEAKSAVETAMAELTARLQTARNALLALRKVAANPELLPPPLRGAFGQVAKGIETTTEPLKEKNAVAAQTEADRIRVELTQTLRQEWAAWLQTYPALDADINLLRSLLDPRRDAARGFTAGGALIAQRAYELAAPSLATPDFDDLEATARALQAWRDFGAARATALVQWTGFIIADTGSFLWLVGSRVPARVNLDDAAEKVRRASLDLVDALKAQLAQAGAFDVLTFDPKPTFIAISELVHSLIAEVKPTPQVSEKALDRLDQRQYFNAVLALAYKGEQVWAEPIGDPTKGTEFARIKAQGGTGAPAPVDPAPAMPQVDAAALEQLRTRSTRDLLVAQRWTTVVVGGITILVSYAFFYERFIGTPGELMGLFFWGMSADLTAAGITTLQGNLGTPPKKP